MNRKRIIGAAALAGFIGCIFVANYAIENWGTVPFPGGPHTVTILGLTAPSGVLVVGLSFSLRDLGQQMVGRWWILAAIVFGAFLSWFVAPSYALASGTAFLFGETSDWLLWSVLVERGKWVAALILSNTIGSLVDSVLFLSIAGLSLSDFLAGQFWLKTLMILPALCVLVPLRVRAYQRRVA